MKNKLPGKIPGSLSSIALLFLDEALAVRDGDRHLEGARQLSLSLLYWLQTEVPRRDGGYGWPGIRPRGDVMGTTDGLAKYPYIRESRRIKALFSLWRSIPGRPNTNLFTNAESDLILQGF